MYKPLLLIAAVVSSALITTSTLASTTPEHPSKAQIYGHILPSGTLETGSKGIASVVHAATGRYCILPSSTILQEAAALGTLSPQITTDYSAPNTLAWEVDVDPSDPSFDCPSTSYINIATGTPQGNGADEAFIVLFE